MRVILGVTGCIAAYKSALLVRELRERNVEVAVVMTTAATRFITPLTLQTLSGRVVTVGSLQDPDETGVEHIDLARWGDLLLVAPATADILGKFAGGVADDFLSTLFTAVTATVLVVPAMNVRMYSSAAVQQNLEVLRGRGVQMVGPDAPAVAPVAERLIPANANAAKKCLMSKSLFRPKCMAPSS